MIKVRKAAERGHANHGWLDSYHTFSFGSYYDPEHIGFRNLRVINEDRVAAGKGFGTHPHSDMEIISYVVSGELEHKDSMGNGSVIKEGEFQIITTGTGITHSEFNPSSENKTHFYQMWVEPDTKGLTPSYGQKAFERNNQGPFQLVASKNGEEGSLTINQDVLLYRGSLESGVEQSLPLSEERSGWLQLVEGQLSLEGQPLEPGDGAMITATDSPKLRATSAAEFLFFDLK